MRVIVPISRNGDTAELHAWYEQIQFPDVGGTARRKKDS
jgi:hypothetical protein